MCLLHHYLGPTTPAQEEPGAGGPWDLWKEAVDRLSLTGDMWTGLSLTYSGGKLHAELEQNVDGADYGLDDGYDHHHDHHDYNHHHHHYHLEERDGEY